jgi:hypothetical protein
MGPHSASVPEVERKAMPPVVGIALIVLLLFIIYWIVRLVLGK